MKKRIIALILILSILLPLLPKVPLPAKAVTSQEAEAYIPAVERVYDTALGCVREESLAAYARGILYDLDQDGTDELVLSYPGPSEQQWLWYYHYSVYDVNQGKLVTVAEDVNIGATSAVAGSTGYTGVALYNGEPVLITYSEGGETSRGAGCKYPKVKCTVKVYSCDRLNLIKTIEVQTTYEEILYFVDNNTVSEEKFQKEMGAFTYLEFVLSNDIWISFRNTIESMPLGELLRYLEKADSGEDTEVVNTKRLAKIIQTTLDDGYTTEYNFFYNQRNQLESIYESYSSDGERVVEYVYDEAGRFIRYKDSDENVYTYEGGKLTKYVERVGDMVWTYTYFYNSAGQLDHTVCDSWFDSSTTRYFYDQNGRLERKEDQNGTTYYSYDSKGRLYKEWDDITLSIYRYDNRDRIKSVYTEYTYPDQVITRRRQFDYQTNSPYIVSHGDGEIYDLWIEDTAGHTVWSLGNTRSTAYTGELSFETDQNGLVISAKDDVWEWEFLYEEDESHPSKFELRILYPEQELIVETGKQLCIYFDLFYDGYPIKDWDKPGIALSGTNVVSHVSCNKTESGYCLIVDALDIGTASLTLSALDNQVTLQAVISVVSDVNPNDKFSVEWIRQHMEYADSRDYSKNIVAGYNGRMKGLFEDTMADVGIQVYDFTDKLLSFNFEPDQSHLYELLLVDLMCASLNEEGGYDLYQENVYRGMLDTLTALCKGGATIEGIDSDVIDSIEDLVDILKTVAPGSTEFTATYNEIGEQIKNAFSLDQLSRSVSKGAKMMGVDILLDGISIYGQTQDKILAFAYNSAAYAATSDDFVRVLKALAHKIQYEIKPSNFPELSEYDQAANWSELVVTLHRIIETIEQCKADRSVAVANFAVETKGKSLDQFLGNTGKAIAKFGINTLLGCIPIVSALPAIDAVLNGGKLAVEVFTSVDERSYCLDMMTKLYCISVVLDSVADDFANDQGMDYFWISSAFDECITLYKGTQLLAVGYMMAYEEHVLIDALFEKYHLETELQEKTAHDRLSQISMLQHLEQKIEWHKNALQLLTEKTGEIQDIMCHEYGLYTDSEKRRIIEQTEKSDLYILAGPAAVIITDEKGNEVAYLGDDQTRVSEGYEMFFRTIGQSDDKEIVKVAVVPKNYTVSIVGLEQGKIAAFVSSMSEDTEDSLIGFFDIPVQENTKGVFSSSKKLEKMELILEDVSYSCITKEENQDPAQNKWITILIYAAFAAGAVFVLLVIRKGKGKFVIILLVVASISFTVMRLLPRHEHTWLEATCVSPRTCGECGETEGESLAHQKAAATCDLPETCVLCGETFGSAPGHTWQNATCTVPQTCGTCGETSGSALGHAWRDATCTAPRTCSSCGETSGEAVHQWVDATYFAPKTCALCGTTEGTPLMPDPVYISELDYCDKYGKLWTMSAQTPGYYVHTDVNDAEDYKDMDTPGHTTGPVYDYLGNSYTYGLHIDGDEYASYFVSYDIGGIYTTFTGAYCMSPDMDGDSRATKHKYFEVYGDGVLLFRSADMFQGSDAKTFTIDISGVRILTIRYPKTSGPSRIATIFDGKLS